MDKDKGKRVVSDQEEEDSMEEEEIAKKIKRSSSCKVGAKSSPQTANNDTLSAPKTHACDLCPKSFSNGKALGGHRRSHFQSFKKKHNHQKKVIKNTTGFFGHSKKTGGDHCIRANNFTSFQDDVYVDDDYDHRLAEETYNCVLCKKRFASRNALFGHMRSHTERTWRGICPPKNSSISNDDDGEEDDDNNDINEVVGDENEDNGIGAIDLAKLTSPSWKKTDKRGRMSIGGYAAAETLTYICAYAKRLRGESKEGEVGATESAPPLFPPPPPPPPPQVAIKGNKNIRKIGEASSTGVKIKFRLKVDNKAIDYCSDELNKGKGLCEKISMNMNGGDQKGVTKVNQGFDHRVSVVGLGRVQGNDYNERKVEKGKNIVIGENSEGEEKLGGYKCGTCGKIFTTFQGLGGHRSIHKGKNIVVDNASKQYNSEDSSVANVATVTNEENHSCSSSGDTNNNQAATDEASQGTRVLDFDLNEPYIMEG
ncbi:hypothetical protein RJT34_00181 [Clitoria ternatea]|uniref:C2H2-type domain-containing protein n=1 Tax=Clitoria ternatea TaxID=43366 RepID=A0AAN9KI48_CLITE